MGPGGDLARAIGEGISGLVAGSIAAISAGIGTMAAALQAALPGPLLPIVLGGVILLIAWWVLRR